MSGSSSPWPVIPRRVGWGGREAQEEGINVYVQLIHSVTQQGLMQHCKAIIL